MVMVRDKRQIKIDTWFKRGESGYSNEFYFIQNLMQEKFTHCDMAGHFALESPCLGCLIAVCRSIRASIRSIFGMEKESEQCSFFWKHKK